MRFRLIGLSTPSVPTLCLKDPLMGKDTIYPKLLLVVRVVCWNKLLGCWQLKDKKNSPLSINNYLLKHNVVTMIHTIYIYIYIYIEREREREKERERKRKKGRERERQREIAAFCCIWETDKWGTWLVKSFYFTQLFREWSFCWRDFSSCGDFFSYSLGFAMDIGFLLSSYSKNIYFYRGFF